MQFWWIRSDPCGLFSAILTVGLILFAQYVIVTIVLLPWYGFTYHIILYTTSSLLALYSHSRCQYMDPGVVPRTLQPPPLPANLPQLLAGDPRKAPPGPRICKECRTLKPHAAYHCSLCERCVMRMDHHCPWVNNCVGMHNQKYFMLFLVYTAICCIYSGVLLVARFLSCNENPRQCTVTGVSMALCIANFVEALVFGLFVIVMLFDQFGAIFDGTARGLDARHRAPGVSKLGRYEALVDVFGEPLSLTWLLPLDGTTKMTRDFEGELTQAVKVATHAAKTLVEHVSQRYAGISELERANEIGQYQQTGSIEQGNNTNTNTNNTNNNNTNNINTNNNTNNTSDPSTTSRPANDGGSLGDNVIGSKKKAVNKQSNGSDSTLTHRK